MAKKVILAVAGAGKTYHICHKIDPTKRNLILAFTHENIHNIQKELCDAHGCVPELTTVSTFDSFVYHQMILPYESSISEHFGCPKFFSRGICTIDPPSRTIKNIRGKPVANPLYKKKDRLEHYVITSTGDHDGAVKWIDNDPSSVLDDDRVIKLVFQNAGKYSFPSLNWSYSKGDTIDSACVILTDGLDNLDSDKFNPDIIKLSTLNKLYVAMTRSRGDLYLMKGSTFKALKDAYTI